VPFNGGAEGLAFYPMQKDDFSELDLPVHPGVSPTRVLLVGSLLFAFAPVARLIHQCTFMWGARSFAPGYSLRLSFYFVCLWAAIHLMLIRRLSTMVYPPLEKKGIPALRVLVVTLFLALPLLSFAYFLSHYRDLMDLNEIFLAIVPGVVITAFIFELTRASIVSSLFLTSAVFVPLFLFNDILSPFVTLGNYASTSAWFYLWRTLLPLGAVWLAVFSWGKQIIPATQVDARLRNWIFSQWAILLYSVSATLLLPMVITYAQSKTLVWPREFAWLAQGAALLCLLVRTRVAYRCAIVLSAGVVAIAVIRTGLFFVHFEVSFNALFLLAERVTVAVFYAWLLSLLIKGTFRTRFER
jgi:hypothetical protein